MCQWGTLTGIENVESSKNIDMIGSVVGAQAGSMADSDDPHSTFEQQNPEAEAGFNLRYGFTSNSSASLAINPDFSQIESDAGRIDVNTTYALFYPERRPFFQEGSDLYNTWIDAIYTRSINAPTLAGKLNGRFGKTSVVYTLARDAESAMIVPFAEYSEFAEVGKSVSNMARVRRSLGDESYAGLLITDRRLDIGGAGSTLGADTALRFLTNYRFRAQLVMSRTAEPDDPSLSEDFNGETFDGLTSDFDGETFWGHGLYTSFNRNGRVWNANLSYTEYSPRFRTDNGFTTHNDFKEVSGWTGLFYRPNRGWLINWEPSVGIGRIWSYAGRFEDEWVRPNLYFKFKGQSNLTLQYLVSRERFAEEIFPGIRIGSIFFNTRPTEILSGGMHFSGGQGIYRDFDAPELGDQISMSANLTFKPSQRLQIQPSWNYAQMESRERDETFYAGYILRTRFNYNFTREWFLRLVLQYNEFSDRFDVEPLLTYRLNPFTVFYIGATSRLDFYGAHDYDELDASEWKLSQQQFFTKVQYLYQF
jgi:hypothetical protein